MKVAVTGATGFIGQHVLSELKKHPIGVVTVVKKWPSVSSLLDDTDIVQIDLNTPPKNAFDLMGRPDVLIHLAWAGLPNYRSLHHFGHELPIQYQFLSGLVRSGLPARHRCARHDARPTVAGNRCRRPAFGRANVR